MLGYLSLLELGLAPALAQRIAGTDRDDAEVDIWINSTLALFAGLGVLGLLIMALIATAIGDLFHLPPAVVPACTAWLLIKGLQFMIGLPLSALRAANSGLGHVATTRAIRSLVVLADVAAGFAAIWLDLGLEGLAWLSLVAAILAGMMQRHALGRIRPGLRLDVRLVRGQAVSQLTGRGAFFAMDSAVVLLTHRTDEIVIGSVITAGAVAVYAIVGHVARSVVGLAAGLVDVLIPSLRSLAQSGTPRHLSGHFERAMEASLMVCAGACILLMAFGADLLAIWLGADVPRAVVVVFGAIVLATAPAVVAGRYLAGAGLRGRLVRISVLEGVMNLALSLLLIGRLGLVGVALATLLAQLATTTWFGPLQACRQLAIEPGRFALVRVGKVLAASLPAGLLAAGMVTWQPAHTPMRLGTQVFICLAIHTVVCFATWMLTWGRKPAP
jgi:O-antigen/teichoic acid export membrane protein